MYKDFDKEYRLDIPRGWVSSNIRAIPDYKKLCITSWTYSDMKAEFTAITDEFTAMGYSCEEVSAAAMKCIQIEARYTKENPDPVFYENVMLKTISLLFKIKNNITVTDGYAEYYRKDISSVKTKKWIFNKFHQDSSEKKAFYADAEYVLDNIDSIIVNLSEENSNAIRESFMKRSSDLNFDEYDGRAVSNWRDYVVKCGYGEYQFEDELKKRLSEDALKMLTEYNRRFYISPEEYYNYVMRPQNVEMTQEIYDFIKFYAGRVFSWSSLNFHINNTDYNKIYYGYRIEMEDHFRFDTEHEKRYVYVMDYNYAGDGGIYLGSDGLLYTCGMGRVYKPITIESFFENEARKYKLAHYIIEHRLRLEEKYFIPEIRHRRV